MKAATMSSMITSVKANQLTFYLVLIQNFILWVGTYEWMLIKVLRAYISCSFLSTLSETIELFVHLWSSIVHYEETSF